MTEERCKRFTRRMGLCGGRVQGGVCEREGQHATRITPSPSEERCEKHDLITGQCADCRGLAEPDPLDGLLVDRFLTARFPGTCFISDYHPIRVGDHIGVLVEDNETGRPPFRRLGYGCEGCVTKLKGGSR